MRERDRHCQIGKWIGAIVLLIGKRAVHGQGDFVPLLKLSADGDTAVTVGLSQLERISTARSSDVSGQSQQEGDFLRRAIRFMFLTHLFGSGASACYRSPA